MNTKMIFQNISLSVFIILLHTSLSVPTNRKELSIRNSAVGISKREIVRDPEAFMTVFEIIRYHGYPAEQYIVTTEDGYILTIHRIPHGKSGPTGDNRKPVLVHHGLFCSSAIWVVNTPDKNLAYILADAGYDVWLGNIRGNEFGRRHTHLSPDEKEFWEFSWDEMAKYDLPAVIDFILGKTGFSQLHYIGHSMGTTIPFAMLSTKPEYNAKMRSLMALAPVATVTNIKSVVRYLKPFANELATVVELFGGYEVLPNSEILKFFSSTICSWSIRELCSNILFILCGFNAEQFNSTRLPVYTHHVPAGTSTQNVLHYGQMFGEDGFFYFDYGNEENKKKYGQPHPPTYNVTKITVPVGLFWSDNDLLADPTDVAKLAVKLQNLVIKYRVPMAKFSHLDFMWAIDVKPLLYDKVLETLDKLWK